MKLIVGDDEPEGQKIAKTRTPPKKKSGAVEFGRVRVKKIRVPHSDEVFDANHVSNIAEAMIVEGYISPIVVRRVSERKANGKKSTKFNLLDGAYRIEAAKLNGKDRIACVIVEGNDIKARLVQIGANLWRKHLTVLQRAEMTVDWLTIASARVNRSGQPVHGKRGGLSGGIALAAKRLPVAGRSVPARRKIIERAVRIAQISPEAKKAAIQAGLDNNQEALLKIAAVSGWKAQLSRAVSLAVRPANATGLPKQNRAVSAGSPNVSPDDTDDTNVVVQSFPLESDADDTTGADESAAENQAPAPPVKETTFDDLEKYWNREGRELWMYAPIPERERFIEMLRRAKCRAQVSVLGFVRDVFRGREKIAKRDLFGLAKRRGLAKRSVRATLVAHGYRAKRRGYGSGAVWYFRNKDIHWKDQQKSVPDSLLDAVRADQPIPGLTKGVDFYEPFPPGQDPYFKNL